MLMQLRDFLATRELLFNWTWKQFRARYSQSLLGITWTILQPFSLMVITSIIFSVFLKVPTQDIPYPIFVYSGLLPWTFFANSLSSAIPSIVENLNIVSKIYFPREILPLSYIIIGLIDFLIASSIFVLMLIFYRIPIGPAVLLLPLVILDQCALIFGISLIGAAVNVFYRDVRFVIPLALQVWLYMSPIFYSVNIVPESFRPIYFMNPMATLVDTYRRLIFFDQMPDWPYFGLASLVSLLMLVIGYRYFKAAEKLFADLI